jgi:hypothetical protein
VALLFPEEYSYSTSGLTFTDFGSSIFANQTLLWITSGTGTISWSV